MLAPVDCSQLVCSRPQQSIIPLKQANGNLAEVSDADAAVDVDVSSVITQVTGVIPSAVHDKLRDDDQQLQQSNGKNGSWKSRVQKLLCCFTPSPVPYYKQDLQLVNSLYQQSLPPQPPRVYSEAVIGAKRPEDLHKKTLVLDLDETLVHSSFKPIPNPDYIIPVEIDGRLVDVYVLKRPWLDHFMNTVGAQQ